MNSHLVIITVLVAAILYLWSVKTVLARRLVQAEGSTCGRRYKEIFENASDAIFVIEIIPGGSYRFDSFNLAAGHILDAEEIGFERKTFLEITRHSADAELSRVLLELSGHLARAISTGLPVKYEDTFRFAAADAPLTCEINLVPMVDDGGISHILCFAHDMSAQKLYEQEMQERGRLEEKLSCFAASAPGFFYTYRHGADGSNSMPFASAGINELFGLHPQDVAHDISPLSLLIHAGDMKLFFEATACSAANMSPLLVEFRVHHPSKGELWIESRALPKSEPDGSVMWHGFMHEVSGRKLAERALQTSHEHLAEAQRIGQMGSWELDLVSGRLTWSDQIYRIFEIDQELFGASYEAFLELIHPDDRDAVNKAYSASVESHAAYCIDHRLLFADGRIKHVRECCETYYDNDGRPLISHGTVQDVTNIKLAELRLQEVQEKLRELLVSRESIRESERKRISWEMHEELGQLLAAMKLHIYAIRAQLPADSPVLKEASLSMIRLVDKSIKTVHDIVSGLRPTALLLGMVPALEWLVADFNKHPEVVCELSAQDDGYLSEELTTLVFRIAQDSLENIVRYSDVSNVHISWRKVERDYILALTHDGYTDSVDLFGDQTLSFFGIQERIKAYGGDMSIIKESERCSIIKARFPVERKC